MTWFFIFLAAFFAFFLYGLLRKPAEAGETFWGLFAFWRWFEERDDIRIGRVLLTIRRAGRWFKVKAFTTRAVAFPRKQWWFQVFLFKRALTIMFWTKLNE